jgi:hypothetical protein
MDEEKDFIDILIKKHLYNTEHQGLDVCIAFFKETRATVKEIKIVEACLQHKITTTSDPAEIAAIHKFLGNLIFVEDLISDKCLY